MFPLFVKSLDMQNKGYVNVVHEYVNATCKYATISCGYDSPGGVYEAEHPKLNTQMNCNLNFLHSRPKLISISSYVATSRSDTEKYTSNSSSIQFQRKDIEESLLANISFSHVQN